MAPEHSLYLLVVDGERSVQDVCAALGVRVARREPIAAADMLADWAHALEGSARAFVVLACCGKTVITAPPSVSQLWCGDPAWVRALGERFGRAQGLIVDYAAPTIFDFDGGTLRRQDLASENEAWDAFLAALGTPLDEVFRTPGREGTLVHAGGT